MGPDTEWMEHDDGESNFEDSGKVLEELKKKYGLTRGETVEIGTAALIVKEMQKRCEISIKEMAKALGAGAGNTKAMTSSINAGRSWGAKTFLNFGVSVADRGASQLARSTAALFFANAVLGYQAQALVKVTAGFLGSYIIGSVLGEKWK